MVVAVDTVVEDANVDAVAVDDDDVVLLVAADIIAADCCFTEKRVQKQNDLFLQTQTETAKYGTAKVQKHIFTQTPPSVKSEDITNVLLQTVSMSFSKLMRCS